MARPRYFEGVIYDLIGKTNDEERFVQSVMEEVAKAGSTESYDELIELLEEIFECADDPEKDIISLVDKACSLIKYSSYKKRLLKGNSHAFTLACYNKREFKRFIALASYNSDNKDCFVENVVEKAKTLNKEFDEARKDSVVKLAERIWNNEDKGKDITRSIEKIADIVFENQGFDSLEVRIRKQVSRVNSITVEKLFELFKAYGKKEVVEAINSIASKGEIKLALSKKNWKFHGRPKYYTCWSTWYSNEGKGKDAIENNSVKIVEAI